MHARSEISIPTLLLLGIASAMPVDILNVTLVPSTCKGQKCFAKHEGLCTATRLDDDYFSGEGVVQ